MWHRFAALAVLTPLFVCAADPPAEKEKKQPALRVDADVPGPFHPFNVTGRYGPHKVQNEDVEGTYHCPVTEHAEDPMVLVFTRDLEVGDKLKSLLEKLDDVTKKNLSARLAATIVFLDKDLPDILGSDDKNEDARRDLVAKLTAKFAGMFTEKNPFTRQNLVIVCLGSDTDLAKYELNPEHKATVVLYNKLKIRAVHAVADLDDVCIDKIMTDVDKQLGASKK